MRIGIDARELCGSPTGVGRHLAGLLTAWGTSAQARAHTFVLYMHKPSCAVLPRAAELRILPGKGGTLWEQTTLARAANADRLDVFFAPGYAAPLRLRMPTVVLIHDLSFVAHPEWFRWREGLRRRILTRRSSQRAAMVLSVSDTARGEIISRLGLPAARVHRIYPGVHRSHTAAAKSADAAMVLFAGSIFNRRHLPDLIEAFKSIWRAHPEARLEIVGDNRTHPRQELASIAAAEGLQDVVSIRSYVNEDTLADLYRQARAFAFLSDYEGFGHPPLEAIACGVPAVLLDTPVARETCGEAALYVSRQPRTIAGALESVLFDEQLRTKLLRAAPTVLARYSWLTAAQHTLEALETAAQR